MRLIVITATDNGVGLERDLRVLRRLGEEAGWEVEGAHHRKGRPAGRFDLVIFAETFVPGWEDLGPVRWMIPNPEWWFAEWDPAIPAFDRVLCKTRDAERIFSARGGRTTFLGWESEDRLDSTIPRERRFLHVAGDSLLKGTEAVLEAWAGFGIPHPLTVVARKMRLKPPTSAVIIVRRLPEAQLRALQNRCLFHLQPSKYEGFGHVVHEALGVGAVLAATGTALPGPHEGSAFQVASSAGGEHGLARLAEVSPEAIRAAVRTLWDLDDAAVQEVRRRARLRFEAETVQFEASFLDLLGAVRARTTAPAPPHVPEPETPLAPATATAASVRWTGPPRVSVVFPCHRFGTALLLRSMLALRHQTADPGLFEVVIAADGGGREYFEPCFYVASAGRLPGRSFRVTWTESPRPRGDVPHRNHARNAGWLAAAGQLCWMLDADFILPPHAIEHLLAEHDAWIGTSRPAVFSPCLAGVGAIGPEAWLEKSTEWARTGSLEDMQAALDCGGVSPCVGGYPDRYVGPKAPASSPLGDLPEGMPVLWRGLLEALGGFDQDTFGEWGGDKEELVDRVKGCARAGLFEVRLLSSVQALHQPHTPDPAAFSAEAKPRTRERERRTRLIAQMATWWRTRLDRVRAALPAVIRAAAPAGSFPAAEPLTTVAAATPAEQPLPGILAAAALHHLRAKGVREAGPCAVVGRWSAELADELRREGVDAVEVSMARLREAAPGSYRRVVLVDALRADLGGGAEALRRAVARDGIAVALERTRLGAGTAAGLLAPMDYQRAVRGLHVAGQKTAAGEVWTVFAGRLAGGGST